MEEEKTPRMAKIKGTAVASHWWWFDSHLTSRRSHWLQSTLEEVDEKTSSMLKIVEEDADSFAQRAEMYYKKRPELISMVEDFYRMHRSLAEKYDQLKSETGARAVGSPFAPKYRTEMFSTGVTDQISDSQSEVYDPDDGAKSEVDDPDHEDERERIVKEDEDGEVMQETEADDQRRDELMEMRDELRRVKQENLIQREELLKMAEKTIEQNASNPILHAAKRRGPEVESPTDEEEAAGRATDGELASSGPEAGMVESGFGGLGLDGMVGIEEEEGEGGMAPPGVGNSGSISGDKGSDEDGAVSGRKAGAADIAET